MDVVVGAVFGEGRKHRRTGRLDHLRGMSSGAKRLVQSLRGRSGGGRGGSGGRGEGGGGEGGGGGGGGASTSATRLCHYDSGHELDEISVVGAAIRGSEGLPTPTTPCHCGGLKYGSGQTLYSIAGLVPPAPAAPAHGAQSGECFPPFSTKIFNNFISKIKLSIIPYVMIVNNTYIYMNNYLDS